MVTNEDVMKRFEDELRLKGCSKKTISNYTLTIKRFLNYFGKNASEITTEEIKKYIIMLQRNCKISSVNTYLTVIRVFFRFAGLAAADDLQPAKAEKNLPVFLTLEEMRRLLKSIDNLRDLALIRLLYASGLRVSELVNLNRDSIEENRIYVKSGKGKKDRIVYIDYETVQIISKYLKKREDKDKALFKGKGERLSTRAVQNLVKKYAEKAGIEKTVTPHTLRHTFATHLLQNKANIMVIKELLGHENLSTTQVYTHVTDEFREEEFNKHPISGL